MQSNSAAEQGGRYHDRNDCGGHDSEFDPADIRWLGTNHPLRDSGSQVLSPLGGNAVRRHIRAMLRLGLVRARRFVQPQHHSLHLAGVEGTIVGVLGKQLVNGLVQFRRAIRHEVADSGRLAPQMLLEQLGEIVTDKLDEFFPRVMDIAFTRFMEEQLDKIEEQHLDWVGVRILVVITLRPKDERPLSTAAGKQQVDFKILDCWYGSKSD